MVAVLNMFLLNVQPVYRHAESENGGSCRTLHCCLNKSVYAFLISRMTRTDLVQNGVTHTDDVNDDGVLHQGE